MKRFTTGMGILPARTLAWVFLLAYLPSVLYVGHFSLPAFDVPGVGIVSIPFISAPAAHEHEGVSESHAAHCHGEQECADSSPGAAPSPVDLLANDLLVLLGGAVLIAVTLAGAIAYRDWTFLPATPPPRTA